MKRVKDQWNDLEEIIRDIGNDSFFSCPITLQYFLNKGISELYISNDGLIVKNNWDFGDDYRILFQKNDSLAKELEEKNPFHLGYSFLSFSKGKSFYSEEFMFDLEELSNLEGSCFKNVRNSYNSFKKNNKGIKIYKKNGEMDTKERVKKFLEKWKREKLKRGYSTASIERDLGILEGVKDKKHYKSILSLDGKVTGLLVSIRHPNNSDLCVNLIRKSIPSAKYAEEYLQVEHSKRMIKKGMSFANDAPSASKSSARFKEKFQNPNVSNKKFFHSTLYCKNKEKMTLRRMVNYPVL